MILVVVLPSSGCPEVSSKIDPTAAIAVMQHKSKQMPLLGVIGVTLTNFPKSFFIYAIYAAITI